MKTLARRSAGLAVVLLFCGCALHPARSGSRTPHFKLGHHSMKVTTKSREAQRAFDRGLTLAYGFSHHAAEVEFRRAAQLDPDLAMAWWGIALVNGPHINFPLVPPDHAKVAWEALGKARALAPKAGEFERSLIGALGKRYASPEPNDRSALDNAYAEAMGNVWRTHPRNADAGTLYAEALMDLHPWDLWKQDGAPQPWTPQIVTTLERVLAIDRNHPGANHLYIHAVEASPHPERALAAADRLRGMVPSATHLVHMPSHIYARVGRWDEAARANLRAIKADRAYRAAYPRPGFYAMYMAHNSHFFAFTAMMRGRSADAIRYARKMVAEIPEDFLREYGPVADGFMIFPSEALMRFGRWKEVLAEPEPRPGLPLSKAIWRYTRASALTALGRTREARAERVRFLKAAADVPEEWTFGNNSAADILAVAKNLLDGEMAAKEGRFETSIASLREAVRIEDGLVYDEPPDWMQPSRHTLGAVLLRTGRPADAEAVYRADLRKYPENGWGLFGLAQALHKQGREKEARAVEARFKKAWSKADVHLGSTCYCQPSV